MLTQTYDLFSIKLGLCRLVGLYNCCHLAVIYKIVKTHMFSPDVLLKNNIHKYSTSKVDTSNPRILRPSVKCQEKQATEKPFSCVSCITFLKLWLIRFRSLFYTFWRSCELKGIFVMCFSWECKNYLFHSISYFILSFQAMNSTDNIVPVEIEDASIQTFHTFPDGSNIQCFSSIFYSGLWELCWRALAVTQWWTSGPPVKDLDWKMYLTSFSTWLSCLLSLVALCSL